MGRIDKLVALNAIQSNKKTDNKQKNKNLRK